MKELKELKDLYYLSPDPSPRPEISGRNLKDSVFDMFVHPRSGLEFYERTTSLMPTRDSGRYIERQVPYINRKGKRAYADFRIVAKDTNPTEEFPGGDINVIMECRRQESQGTAKNKLQDCLDDLKAITEITPKWWCDKSQPVKYIIWVLEGKYFDKHSDEIEFLEERIENTPHKLIRIMNLEYLFDWSIEAFTQHYTKQSETG